MTVTLAGQDVTSMVTAIQVRLGLSQSRYAQADVTFGALPTSWNPWDALTVNAGLDSPDMSGNLGRFSGFALDPSVTFWPYRPKLAGVGPLAIADKTRVLIDPYGGQVVGPIVPPAWWDVSDSTGFADGISLLQGSASGQTDSAMVSFILAQCGLDGWINAASDIGGLAPKLGVLAPDQFIWRVDQTGLQAIEEIDKMSTYRTYETLAGNIVRRRQTPFAPFPPSYTFIEGTNILEGSTITRASANDLRNAVTVSGYNDGSGAVVYRVAGSVPFLPPGGALQNEQIDCSLIEKSRKNETDKNGNPLPGYSCEEAANEWLSQLSVPLLKATVKCKVDFPFEPGMVVYVNSPRLLGVNQSLWVQDVTIDVTPTSFSQTLALQGADYTYFNAAVASLPMALPAGLAFPS